MRVRPVVVVNPSLSRLLIRWVLSTFALLALLPVIAQAQVTETVPLRLDDSSSGGYLARIGFNDPEQLNEALERVQAFYEENDGETPSSPISIVVHGPEVEVFAKGNYEEYKNIVDRAAQLAAFGVLDIAVCETRLGIDGVEMSEVYPFVNTVPFGPDEEDRLITQEKYIYF